MTGPKISRKEFLSLTLATATASLFAGSASGTTRSASIPSASRTLIRRADVLTMDGQRRELKETDVLIDGGRIAAIGHDLPATDAATVDASGMILMPGMIDGHRHAYQSLLAGYLVKFSTAYQNYLEEIFMKASSVFRPEDLYLGEYIGGLVAIDSGVTAIVDHAEITYDRENAEAAARGLIDSGVGGFFCYQLSQTPTYTPGESMDRKRAWAQAYDGISDHHLRNAAWLRDKYFTDNRAALRFGVGLSHAELSLKDSSIDAFHDGFRRARDLAPGIMTQHVMGETVDYFKDRGIPEYRIVPDLYRNGLLGPDYHVSHGNGFTDEELIMLRDTGSHVAATTMGEFTYPTTSIHGRARRIGLPVGIGVDTAGSMPTGFFEHVRTACWSLMRSEEDKKTASRFEAPDLLAFVTSEGAEAIGMGDEIGSIAVGKRADLVLLSTRRFGFPKLGTLSERVVTFAESRDVDSVWVAGVRRKSGGTLLGVDSATLDRQIADAQAHIVENTDRITFTGKMEF